MLVLALERTVLDGGLPRDAAARTWREVRDDLPEVRRDDTRAQLTILRNAPHDSRNRQVYLWDDGESLGKLRFDVPISVEIPPGPHGGMACDFRPTEHVRQQFPSPSGRGIKGEGRPYGHLFCPSGPELVIRRLSLTPALSRWEKENQVARNLCSRLCRLRRWCIRRTCGHNQAPPLATRP